MKLDFLINRLMRMSLNEIIYRVKQKVNNEYESRVFKSYKLNTGVIKEDCRLFQQSLVIENKDEIIKKADKICEGIIDIFSLKDFSLGGTIDYHKDYKSGKSAPSNMYGKKIDYRNSEEYGDIKYIWEPNRVLFMVTLSLAYHITEDKKYLEKFEYYLLEWIKQNPFLIGVNWSSSLENGIRLINWVICWHLIGDKIDQNLKKMWLDSIYGHCWFIYRNMSAYSSANNHLIGEVAGLFAASTALPQFDMSGTWREKAYSVLVRECLKQNFADGVNKEQAVSYQQFVLDFLIICALVGKANKIEFPKEYWDRIEKMMEYLAAIEDAKGNIPQIGDEDDGYVVDLGQREYGVYRSLLNTGAFIFKRGDFCKRGIEMDDKTRLLLNIGGISTEAKDFSQKAVPVKFPDGGYYLLGRDFGGDKEQKLLFDCGPLGYLSLAAHGHADALSFTFSAGGCPIFIDPGTYAYHANKAWRNYFRGTSAHNALSVDNTNQSKIAGNFMWSKKAEAVLLEYNELVSVKGKHNGYLMLEDGLEHTREIRFDDAKNRWSIIDSLVCSRNHEISVYFNIHPSLRCEVFDNIIHLYFEKGVCHLEFEKELGLKIYKGEENPILGWYSASYDVKVPTETIELKKNINGSTKIHTDFWVEFKA